MEVTRLVSQETCLHPTTSLVWGTEAVPSSWTPAFSEVELAQSLGLLPAPSFHESLERDLRTVDNNLHHYLVTCDSCPESPAGASAGLPLPRQHSQWSAQGRSYWPLTPVAPPRLDSASAKSGCQPETVRKQFLQTPAWRQDSPEVQPGHSCTHLSPLSSCVFHPGCHTSLHLSEPEQPLEATCSAFV